MTKEVDDSKRRFLKFMLYGAGALVAARVLKPVELLAQDECNGVPVDVLMTNALKYKGDLLNSYDLPFGNGRLNVRMEYICGPRGGSGKLRVVTYLPKNDWCNTKGLDKVKFWFYSTEETNLSKKIYEVNLNKYYDLATNLPIQEITNIGEEIIQKLKGKAYALLKIFKINKEDINQLLDLKELVDIISEDRMKQYVAQMGNLIAKDHVWLNRVTYDGYGGSTFFDLNLFSDGKVLRAPKLVDIEIWEGEGSFVGLGLSATYRKYVKSPDFKRGYEKETGKAALFAPLDMKTLLKNH